MNALAPRAVRPHLKVFQGFSPAELDAVAKVLAPLGPTANAWLETIGLWLHVGVILGFLLIVLNSKHLHIFAAPINVYFSRNFTNAKTDLGYLVTMETFWQWFARDPALPGLGGSAHLITRVGEKHARQFCAARTRTYQLATSGRVFEDTRKIGVRHPCVSSTRTGTAA